MGNRRSTKTRQSSQPSLNVNIILNEAVEVTLPGFILGGGTPWPLSFLVNPNEFLLSFFSRRKMSGSANPAR